MKASRRIFLSFLCFILVVVSVCPFASAAESYNIPFSQPQVADGSGYMEVLFESSGGSRYVRLFQWQTTPSTQMIGTEKILTNVTVNSNGLVNIEFDYPESTFYAVVSIYDGRWSDSGYFEIWQDVSVGSEIAFNLDYDDNIISFNIYGNYTNLTSNLVSGYLPKFTVTYGDDTSLSDVSSSLTEINNTLVQIHNDNLATLDEISAIQDGLTRYLELLHQDFGVIEDSLTEANVWLDFISDQLNDFSDRIHNDLSNILTGINQVNAKLEEVKTKLDSISNYLRLQWMLMDKYYAQYKTHLANIQYYISQIKDALLDGPDSNLTSPDTSNMDGYIDTENSLLDNSNVDVSDVVQVEVNQNALSFIWSLVQKIFDSNGKVFGMVLTVLSLGLVAMVLGRKV